MVQYDSSRNRFLSVSSCSKPGVSWWLEPEQYILLCLNEIARYVVLLYQRTSSLSHVNGARKQLFAQNRKMEKNSSNIACSWTAREKGCLSSRAHMGAVTHWRARSCIARFMGLEESDRWCNVDSMLDHSSRGSHELSGTLEMWLQEGLH